MKERLLIPMPVVVEGKYDKIRLSNVIDAQIFTTDGFGIFRRREQLALLRALAAPRGLIVLTDSDGAGKLIRAHLTSAIPPEKLIQLYVPRVRGKERRKASPSKAGLLGVEGIDDAVLYELFAPLAADAPARGVGGITKADLYTLGLSGAPDAASRRAALAERLGLPGDMTAPALLAALNILYTRKEFLALAGGACGDDADEQTESLL